MNIGCDRADVLWKELRSIDGWPLTPRPDQGRYVSDSQERARPTCQQRRLNCLSPVSVLDAKNVHPAKSTARESPATFLLPLPQLLPPSPPAAQHPFQPLKLLLLYSSRLELGSLCRLGQFLLCLPYKKTETIKPEPVFNWHTR